MSRDHSEARQRESPEREVQRRIKAASDEGAAGLLALVRGERARMSQAVLGNADKLSSAVSLGVCCTGCA